MTRRRRDQLSRVDQRKSLKRCAEFRQRHKDSFRVLRVGSHQNVNILRRSRLRVNRNRVSSHDKVLNAVLVQNGQEFFEVGVHRELRPSARNVLG